MNWYRAELDSREGLIPSNYIEMKSHEYVIIIVWYMYYRQKLNNYYLIKYILVFIDLL